MRRQSVRGIAFRRVARAVGVLLTVGALAGCSVGSRPIAGTATPMESTKPANAAELMTKLRAVDPCSVLDPDTAKRYGPKVKIRPAAGNDLDHCAIYASGGNDKSITEFDIELGSLGKSGLDENGIHLTDPQRDVENDGTVSDTCFADYPSGVENVQHELYAAIYTLPGQIPPASPQRACVAAKTMILAMRPELDRLAPVPPTLGKPSLYSKNPCRAADRFAGALPGSWQAGPRHWSAPYVCSTGLTDPTAQADAVVEVRFSRGIEVTPEPNYRRSVTVAGLPGVEMRNYDGGCSVSLVYRQESAHRADDAQMIEVTLSFAVKGTGSDSSPATITSASQAPFDSCNGADDVLPVVVADANN